jgi:hypothetical protein
MQCKNIHDQHHETVARNITANYTACVIDWRISGLLLGGIATGKLRIHWKIHLSNRLA